MKKITLLVISITIICTASFGQLLQKSHTMQKTDKGLVVNKQTNVISAKDAVWSNDFSNDADWLIGHIEGAEDADWIITTVETAPEGYIPVFKMVDAIESPTADNGFALFNSDVTGSEDGELQDAWIQIANPINLSTLNTPRFVFNAYYKKFYDETFFEYSTDGGTNWESIELFTDLDVKDITATDYQYLLNVPALGGASNVLFRFRKSGDWDYGIYIDDIFVVESPDYDLVLKSSAINFFEADDYTIPGEEAYYHISSHLGMIPDEILKNENAWINFNAVVFNNGVFNAYPSVDVTILSPGNANVYNITYTSTTELAPGEQDTLAIAWGENEEFYVTEDNFQLGEYLVNFDLYIDGIEDDNLDNNSKTIIFESTDYIYAHDGGHLDGNTGPGDWVDGDEDGALMGVNYLFFEETVIDSVQAFITTATTPGTTLKCHLLQIDSETSTWVNITSSALINIQDTDLGAWKTFTFDEPADVVFDEGEINKTIKVALEFFYAGDGNDLWIGVDNTVPASIWGTQWKLVGAESWVSMSSYSNSTPMIRAYITPTIDDITSNFANHDINMYPNPSSGIVTISNVEGATIEIINIMGQVVASVENANEINDINLSNNAEGTYIVRITNDNEISTSKLYLIK